MKMVKCYKHANVSWASENVTDLHNTVSARISIVKDDITFRVAVGRAVKIN